MSALPEVDGIAAGPPPGDGPEGISPEPTGQDIQAPPPAMPPVAPAAPAPPAVQPTAPAQPVAPAVPPPPPPVPTLQITLPEHMRQPFAPPAGVPPGVPGVAPVLPTPTPPAPGAPTPPVPDYAAQADAALAQLQAAIFGSDPSADPEEVAAQGQIIANAVGAVVARDLRADPTRDVFRGVTEAHIQEMIQGATEQQATMERAGAVQNALGETFLGNLPAYQQFAGSYVMSDILIPEAEQVLRQFGIDSREKMAAMDGPTFEALAATLVRTIAWRFGDNAEQLAPHAEYLKQHGGQVQNPNPPAAPGGGAPPTGGPARVHVGTVVPPVPVRVGTGGFAPQGGIAPLRPTPQTPQQAEEASFAKHMDTTFGGHGGGGLLG